ncbi:hypothetical protein B0H15DRAFT_997482 [Mycena belliarum]|uniref:C2H2-type domain-containing protein n=1 Tax=Mycena belliarum TaxID=1033014 RepID=A0AAD6TVZ2_9AGAR|nr:hypothetical protein B0H15DRAFT_997482 [Mycena belliae]
MALTLPIETFLKMKVSFRVGHEGAFAFDMAPGTATDVAGLQLESGLKIHLNAVRDADGVTLTLCTSGPSSSRLDEKRDPVLDSNSPPATSLPDQAVDYQKSDNDSDSRSGLEPEHNQPPDFMSFPPSAPTSEPFDMTLPNLPLEGFDSLNYLFDFPDAQSSFNNYFLDSTLNLEYQANSDSNLPSFNDTDSNGSPAESSSSSNSEFAFAEETPATTPSTSSESLPNSPPLRPRGTRAHLRCTHPGCGRHFTSNYTLSKHIKAHAPKSQKFFPCTLGCAMRFSRKHDRLRHEVTQHGRVCEWGCPACLGFFSSEATLKKHKCRNPTGTRWVGDQDGRERSV